jgi:sugar phosphate isomerase/epimerase
MKLSVSTLGCPEWNLETIAARCSAFGYAGVELRGVGPDIDLTQSPYFATQAACERSKRMLADVGLTICSVDSSTTLGADSEATWTEQWAHGQQMIDLAVTLDAPLMRVFGGDGPPARTAERLRELGEYTASVSENVVVVLETHDSYSTGAQVAQVLSLADHPRVAALWDLHHPYRQGEQPAATWDAIGPWVRHLHVKDSIPGGSYCLLGEGDIPVRAMLRLLRRNGYDGWLSLEWEKRWHPGLADPEIAFPQYAETLRQYLAEMETEAAA